VGAVAPDADVLIGFLDDRDAHHALAVRTLGPFLAPGHRVVLAASVYAEILVRPLKLGRASEVDAFLVDARVRMVAVDRAVARRAAELRAEHASLRLPDALALAVALVSGAALLTFDERLARLAAGLSRQG
jgi:predicted nucleic acid-binding protein